MKTFAFAGREWEMKPLTLRQKKLIARTETALREAFLLTAKAQLMTDMAEQLQALYDAGCRVDSIVVGEDFPAFLATILTPSGVPWKSEFREKHAPLMDEIPNDVQAEVLLGFFSGQTNGIRQRQNSSLEFASEAPRSIESGKSGDSPDLMTTM